MGVNCFLRAVSVSPLTNSLPALSTTFFPLTFEDTNMQVSTDEGDDYQITTLVH